MTPKTYDALWRYGLISKALAVLSLVAGAVGVISLFVLFKTPDAEFLMLLAASIVGGMLGFFFFAAQSDACYLLIELLQSMRG